MAGKGSIFRGVGGGAGVGAGVGVEAGAGAEVAAGPGEDTPSITESTGPRSTDGGVDPCDGASNTGRERAAAPTCIPAISFLSSVGGAEYAHDTHHDWNAG